MRIGRSNELGFAADAVRLLDLPFTHTLTSTVRNVVVSLYVIGYSASVLISEKDPCRSIEIQLADLVQLQRCQMQSAFMTCPIGIAVKTSSQVTAANEMFAFRGRRPRGADVYSDFLIILVIKMHITTCGFCCKNSEYVIWNNNMFSLGYTDLFR